MSIRSPYQRAVRADLRDRLASETGVPEPTESSLTDVASWIETRLNGAIAELPAFAGRFRVAPGSVRFLCARTFEVDFGLESLTDRSASA